MSEGRKFYWLKLKRDFFKRHDIHILNGMEYGREIVLFYIKLMLESVDHEGELRFSKKLPYTNPMLANLTDTPESIVDNAMEVLQELKLVEIIEDGTIVLPKVMDMIGFETDWAKKKREQRKLPQLVNGSKRCNDEFIILPNGQKRFVDEKRYGGNGMLVLDRSQGKCELCGSDDKVLIHHNNGYSNEPEDLVCLCTKCHGIVHSSEWGGHIPPDVLSMSPISPEDVPSMSDKSIEIRDKSIEYRDNIVVMGKITRKTFSKPTLEEISAYCQERNNSVDAQRFFDYYEAKGWVVGKSPMKDWKAAVRTWERNESEPKPQNPKPKKYGIDPDYFLQKAREEDARSGRS